MSSPQHLSPRSLAAYCAWLAVASEPLARSLLGKPPGTAALIAGSLGLCAVLLLFLAREQSLSLRIKRGLVLAQIPAALTAVAAFDGGLQPILLILVAVQLTILFARREAVLWMLAANVALLAILLLQEPLPTALVMALAYVGFQAFAASTTQALEQAQQARDLAQAINAELLATRALLAEGARASERLHLSRELHDVAGHKLTALKLQLGLCATGSGEAAAALAASRQLADELLSDVRGVVGALRAHDGVDLHAALSALAASIPSPRITLALADDARPADFARAQALLRAAQEGVTNALRHAAASTLCIELAREAGLLRLSVRDNGRGAAHSRPGNGLTGLSERLATVGGTLHLETMPGGGSCLSATVPA